MALLAEELVEEWLNRQRFFTIRGIKLGVHEVDLLAVRHTGSGVECRHVEVQASVRPVSYLTPVCRQVRQRDGRAPGSARLRPDDELREGVREWVDKKFGHPRKKRLRDGLVPGQQWSRELVVNECRYPRELELLAAEGVTVIRLASVVSELHDRANGWTIEAAAGGHLVDLVALSRTS